MDVIFRDFEPERDIDAAVRIWKEVGWISAGEEKGLAHYVEGSRGMMAEIGGTPECLVLTTQGDLRYLAEDLPLCAVTGVTTGRVARRQGLARRLLARMLARDAAEGAAVSALGVFEQGFYDRLGYGTGSYSYRARFDPAQLRVTAKPRAPVRITSEDWEQAHTARLLRRRVHGCCNLYPPGITRSEMWERPNAFGMGYRDGPNGTLSHFVWCHAENMERGPYRTEMVYRTWEQMNELLAVIKSLADQIVLVSLREPPGLMLQDWLDKPFRHMAASEGGKFEARISASAYWQARVMDLHACLARTRLAGPTVRFNLHMDDPLEALSAETGWSGVGGSYVVGLGPESSARLGKEPDLPTLYASVGAFTRMWLGVRPASGLAATDALRGPVSLLSELDAVLRLPEPQPDWDF